MQPVVLSAWILPAALQRCSLLARVREPTEELEAYARRLRLCYAKNISNIPKDRKFDDLILIHHMQQIPMQSEDIIYRFIPPNRYITCLFR